MIVPREIPLTRGRAAIVDDEDFEMLSAFSWHFRPMRAKQPEKGYAALTVRPGDGHCLQMFMHQMLISLPKGVQVDHINGNSLDYRRQNLRPSTQAQNARNVAKPKHARSSRFKGVWHDRRTGKWQAYITADRRRYHLGVFGHEEDAARAYNDAARRLHGAFARLNEVPGCVS